MLLPQVLIVRLISCGDILISFLMLMTGRALKERLLNEIVVQISKI